MGSHDTAPLLDLTTPEHPVLSEVGRDLFQWTALDPMVTPVRATSRAYRTNTTDDERLHLSEAVGYLRSAPTSNDSSALTQSQLDTVIARLELRKKLLGGLVDDRQAARVGQEDGFEQERIRTRNWELLRECAEKTGLVFDPIELAGSGERYAILWFPRGATHQSNGLALNPIWKLLNIRDPWKDDRLKSGGPIQLVPLAVYSLDYPKLPLLLLDFRDKLRVRRHEMTQRSINEITAGVIGISHFTNWYYYVAADLYDFISARHGGAVNEAARLDAYSQFRADLALDRQLDPRLRAEMENRVQSIAVNPLGADAAREIQAAKARYGRLQEEADNGVLAKRLDQERRAELAQFGASRQGRFAWLALHDATLGLYTKRAKEDQTVMAQLDRDRRIQRNLNFLDSLSQNGTQPEIAYSASQIDASVSELNVLLPGVESRDVRAHAAATLRRIQALSRDKDLQAGCESALVALRTKPWAAGRPAIATSLRIGTTGAAESLK